MDMEEVELLLRNRPALLHQKSEGHNRTLLWEAVNSRKAELTKYLISLGADLNIPGRYRNKNLLLLKPYCIAVLKKQNQLAQLLLDSGHEMDIYSASYLGLNDKITSMMRDNSGQCNELLSADKIWNCTALHYAALGGNVNTIKTLISGGADVRPHSKLLYEIACRADRFDIIALVSKHGADPSAADVPSVLYPDNKDISDFFFSNGLDPNKAGWKGWPPIAYLSRGDKGEHPDRIKTLIKYGAEVNAANPKGITALHAAAKAGFVSVVKVLLDAGANTNAKDNSGRKPIDLSLKFKKFGVAELLKKHRQ